MNSQRNLIKKYYSRIYIRLPTKLFLFSRFHIHATRRGLEITEIHLAIAMYGHCVCVHVVPKTINWKTANNSQDTKESTKDQHTYSM